MSSQFPYYGGQGGAPPPHPNAGAYPPNMFNGGAPPYGKLTVK